MTRPKHQAENLCQLIEQQGWNAIRFPTMEIVAIDNKTISDQLDAINKHQWLIFISANAVYFALKANNGKIDHFKDKAIAAIGKSTEKALKKAGLPVDLVPKIHFNTEGLLASSEMNNVKGMSCLIIRGKGGRERLAEGLRERGATVEYMEVYAREKPCHNDQKTLAAIEQGKLQAITITSGEALKNLLTMIDQALHDKLLTVPLIVISSRIKRLAEQYRFKQIAVTESPSDTAIIETVIMSLSRRLSENRNCSEGNSL